MSKGILQKYAGRQGGEADDALAVELDVQEDLGSFGFLRGIRDRSPMLELRRKNGDILAIGYAWIERVHFDPSDGITITAGGGKIRIRGRNLNSEVRPSVRLFEVITRHRVPWVRETSQADRIESGDKACVVESIEW